MGVPRALVPVLLTLTTASCSAPALSPTGARVRASSSPPDPRCKLLGHVVGNGGGTFGGAWIPNTDLVTYARNDLLNQAAALGADYVQTEAAVLSTSGSINQGSGTLATSGALASGDAYRCGAALNAAPAAPAKTERAPAPKSVAGFAFGESADDAQSTCEGANETWAEADGGGRCSGTATGVGFEAEVLVTFVKRHLAGIELVAKPSTDAPGVLMGRIKRGLVDKYGEPEEVQRGPKECANAVAACRKDGRLLTVWRWALLGGRTIELSVAGSPNTVHVAYPVPVGVDTGAL